MGESFAQPTYNEATHNSSAQPIVSIVAEDDDEPPSTGLPHYRSSEVTHSARGNTVDVQVHTRDFALQGHAMRNSTSSTAIPTAANTRKNSANFEHDIEKEAGELAAVSVQETRPPSPTSFKNFSPRKAKFATLFTPRHPVGPIPSHRESLMNCIRYTPLNAFLVIIPISWALHFTHQNETVVFVLSGLGLVPLAALLGFGTEQIALRTSQSVGGLLNATLGNLIEMIISGIALQKVDFTTLRMITLLTYVS